MIKFFLFLTVAFLLVTHAASAATTYDCYKPSETIGPASVSAFRFLVDVDDTLMVTINTPYWLDPDGGPAFTWVTWSGQGSMNGDVLEVAGGTEFQAFGIGQWWTITLNTFRINTATGTGTYQADPAGGVPDFTWHFNAVDVDDPDYDDDGVENESDNCPYDSNPGQEDSDGNGIGDACDFCSFDTDGDGICDDEDNCPEDSNPGQEDGDGNGIGDACDTCTSDNDRDGICDDEDNCPDISNPGQEDSDGNGIGDACDSCPQGNGWAFISAETEKGNPELRHYVWETTRPPCGPFDKVALHRIVNEPNNCEMIGTVPSPDKSKVIFVIPETNGDGRSKIEEERYNMNIFLANRGYDVYTMDFRPSYLPNLAYDQFETFGHDINSTANWTYGVYSEDIHACVSKAKDISSTNKLFMAGVSRGGAHMWIYASKYWKEDLKGLICLDGGSPLSQNNTPSRSIEEYNAAIADFKATGMYLNEIQGFEQRQYAAAVPYSLKSVGFESLDDAVLATLADIPNAQYPPPEPIETVSDLIAYSGHFSWGDGLALNYYGGFVALDILVKSASDGTRYSPTVQVLESVKDLDYAKNDAEVDLPIIFFGSEFGCPNGDCLTPGLTYRCAGTDVTMVYLEGFGHLDVYVGEDSLEKVQVPLLNWMNDRRLGEDLNQDGCIDRTDYNIIITDIRGPEPHNMVHDLNEDGNVNIADARYLATLFTNSRGAACN